MISPEKSSDIVAYRPQLIVSGGQTGADFGALVGARDCGIATGGYAPKGFRTERGPQPELGSIYGLLESSSDDYPKRTEENVLLSNAIVLIANNFKSPGSALTKKLAFMHAIPIFEVPYSINPKIAESTVLVRDLQFWLDCIKPDVLMFAGNRESKARGIQTYTTGLIKRIFGCA